MKFKVGDKVKCIKKIGQCQTNGKIYEVIDIDEKSYGVICIINDHGNEWWCFEKEFELVQEDKPTYNDYCDGVHEELSKTTKLKPISQTYSIDGFKFIIGDEGISIPGKHDEKLWFKNSKKSVVKKFRQALDKFCDEMDI